jgi:2-oxoglutarate dehydrogenase E1 component
VVSFNYWGNWKLIIDFPTRCQGGINHFMDLLKEFYGPNAGYVIELYDRYIKDPASVDPDTRASFDQWSPVDGLPYPSIELSEPLVRKDEHIKTSLDPIKAAAAATLAQSIRIYGHWAAHLDPLNSQPPGDPSLRLDTYNLTEDDLRRLPASLVGGIAGQRAGTALEAINFLRQIYSSTVGHDYLQIRDSTERQWLREAAETRRFAVENLPIDPVGMLDRLTQVETFEHFLQRAFPGRTRFSIEGLDTLIPLLDEVISSSAQSGIYNILLGMAHRGRLNVLAHILHKPMLQILAEFKDPLRRRALLNEPDGWAGDVKYHAGARREMDEDDDGTIDLTIVMAPNPSHLEAINPVVEGMARAAGTLAEKPGPATFDPSITLPILIHGDASFPGQGVVAETLNMYQLKGYTTGGTIHIIANNQLGFTATPGESRSTLFASDIAKGYRIPVIHVNADDPEGVIMAARLAFAYRAKFHQDFLIDLIGYRRLGHNEGDEPAFTQPLMYKAIDANPTVRQIWAGRLVDRGILSSDFPDQLYQKKMADLQSDLEKLDPEGSLDEPIPPPPPPGAARKVKTSVPREQVERLSYELLRLPDGFQLHNRLARIRQRRERVVEEAGGSFDTVSVDWSSAEELAFASILEEGIAIRLTGQDVERGTFSHRHAVLHDAQTGNTFIPFQNLPQAKAAFEIYNSPLSEYAALGFEFGYNVQAPDRLVIWEAQYGDFINNAQAVVDEFIVSARDKWGQLPALVMLLPHGYEGQGPDHSSGRLERFLSLASDTNLRVANCTTAANYFHLLRRQALLLKVDPLPLVVMTPKSLLRHPLVSSPMRELVEGSWQPLIPPILTGEPTQVRRLVLCSGKIYVDLISVDNRAPEIAIARIEQLAPFPIQDIQNLLETLPGLEELVWVQEEPENMGAWHFARPFLEEISDGRINLSHIGRLRSASPAEGSNNLHAHIQRHLVEQALDMKPEKVKNHQ